MAKQAGSFLQGKVPKVKQLNKPVIWAFGAAVGLILLIVIVMSLQQPEYGTKKEKTGKATAAGTIGQSVADLPASYTDKEKIGQYLQDSNAKLKSQIDDLRRQTAKLQQQISALSRKPSAPVTRPTVPAKPVGLSEKDKQAARSSLFFPGGVPVPPKPGAKGALAPGVPGRKPGAAGRAGYQSQNMQSEKLSFIKSQSDKEQDEIYNPHELEYPVSPYEIQAGNIIPAILITAINTDVPGEAVAEIRQNVYDSVRGKYLLIPSGSKLVGQYDSKPSYGQSRVLIVFNRIIRPDGTSILLSSSSADLFGAAGMEGDVNNHWGRILGAAALSSLLSFGTGLVADRTTGTTGTDSSVVQGGLSGVASSFSQTGNQIVSKQLNLQPTLTLPAGYEFNIIVNKDVILEPYKGLRRGYGNADAN